MTELKPCPFCGSNNIICPLPWIISCDSCGFEFNPPSHFGEGLTDKQRQRLIIEDWNRRANE